MRNPPPGLHLCLLQCSCKLIKDAAPASKAAVAGQCGMACMPCRNLAASRILLRVQGLVCVPMELGRCFGVNMRWTAGAWEYACAAEAQDVFAEALAEHASGRCSSRSNITTRAWCMPVTTLNGMHMTCSTACAFCARQASRTSGHSCCQQGQGAAPTHTASENKGQQERRALVLQVDLVAELAVQHLWAHTRTMRLARQPARTAWRQEEAHLFGICNAAVHARQLLLQPGQAGLRSLCVCAGGHPLRFARTLSTPRQQALVQPHQPAASPPRRPLRRGRSTRRSRTSPGGRRWLGNRGAGAELLRTLFSRSAPRPRRPASPRWTPPPSHPPLPE